MAHDDDDDLYDEEFDFVDDDDDDLDADDDHEEASAEGSDIAEEPAAEREPEPRKPAPRERVGDRPQRPERAPNRAERADRVERPDDRAERPEGEGAGGDEEPVDEYGRPESIPANYVVHVYDQQKFSRTIDRPFTPEDAEAFASEFNRTSKNYGRFAVTGKNDAKPKKTLD